ncbi:MAG: carbon starvation protein A, partial [Candidatus Omnitrophica bacterium]|nr:carbon starvation protein A [Candidatus Omnitrophota bacterium]
PVNILLQPRDYLSSFMLFFGMGAGYIGILLMQPQMKMPFYIKFNSQEAGMLWPALFITVACGAVSGFHSLIASGTSSKQIASERHVKRIGYGAMVAEAILAILAIISVAVLFEKNDNFTEALKNLTPIGIFGKGYGLITQNILSGYGQLIAITILNAFILTTLDTATRIARYLSEELFKINNRYISTAVIIIISAGLAVSGKWAKLWPAFGASNQLVAALALLVLSCWLLTKKRNIQFTLWPAVFMLATTIAALIMQAVKYFSQKELTLFTISIALIILAGFMVYEVITKSVLRRPRHA